MQIFSTFFLCVCDSSSVTVCVVYVIRRRTIYLHLVHRFAIFILSFVFIHFVLFLSAPVHIRKQFHSIFLTKTTEKYEKNGKKKLCEFCFDFGFSSWFCIRLIFKFFFRHCRDQDRTRMRAKERRFVVFFFLSPQNGILWVNNWLMVLAFCFFCRILCVEHRKFRQWKQIDQQRKNNWEREWAKTKEKRKRHISHMEKVTQKQVNAIGMYFIGEITPEWDICAREMNRIEKKMLVLVCAEMGG